MHRFYDLALQAMVGVSRYTVAEYLRGAASRWHYLAGAGGARRRGTRAQAVYPAIHLRTVAAQPDWPARATGAGLLAHVLVVKYCDHLPLDAKLRSSPARTSISAARPWPTWWPERTPAAAARRRARAARYGGDRVHADDTVVPVLESGLENTGRHGSQSARQSPPCPCSAARICSARVRPSKSEKGDQVAAGPGGVDPHRRPLRDRARPASNPHNPLPYLRIFGVLGVQLVTPAKKL